MVQVNMHEAKTQLSALVRQVEEGTQDRVVIARNGKPVAMIVEYDSSLAPAPQRIGIARGRRLVPDDWDFNEFDDEVASMFGVM